MANLDRRTFLAAGAGTALTVLAAGRASAAPSNAGQKVVYSYPGLTPPPSC
ncbi:hypothetical protein [Tsukamurella soli]|uniref:hypothetical protein n=1 Tax=Tsukamurella soli TaxID=644556 RepID=UPI00361B8BD6